MKKLLVLFIAIALLTSIGAVQAITYGQPDVNNEYPWVGLVITPAVGGGYYICSGSLIAPTVFLTAGHCADNTDASGNPAPYLVTLNQSAPWNFVPGMAYPHPNWTGALTVPNTNDVGVVVLSAPLPGPYGQLAPEGFVDELLTQRGTKDLGFTAIGYGLQDSQNPHSKREIAEWDIARYFGFQRLVQTQSALTKGYSIMLTNNPGKGNGVGGTCSGDSGGPIMHTATGYIVAVNSFGVAPYCKGNDYAYRVDIPNSRNFINGFLVP